MSDTSALVAAVGALTEAQAKLVEAYQKLTEHNGDTGAHPDLREEVQKILDSDIPYTRSEVEDLAAKKVKEHADVPFETAHPGWDDIYTEINAKQQAFEARLKTIEDKLADTEVVDRNTELQRTLAAIEAKYATILDNLQASYQVAYENGNLALAEEYRKTIATTLDEKKAELLAAMEAWQNS